MKTLCMDTAHRFLTICLYENETLVCSIAKPSWKRQSETIFPELMKLMDQAGWQSEAIDEIVITDGPGSYTGVRIAMSIAKVFCTTRHVPLYTISSLQLYAGLDHAFVLLDARSNRAYCGELNHGSFVSGPSILTLDEIKQSISQYNHVIGDTNLLDIESDEPNFTAHFMALRPLYNLVENVHILTPEYLKDQNAYKVG